MSKLLDTLLLLGVLPVLKTYDPSEESTEEVLGEGFYDGVYG